MNEIPDYDPAPLREALGIWFERVARDLPWRQNREPYTTWLSEIMLQQTRVDQALPYFERFIARFPTVRVLAETPLDDVLHAWEGLGYYSRARNLHRTARIVADAHQGVFPASYDALRSLPGIGPYSAAAIASQAFGLEYAAVDGNVIRVLTRLSAEEGLPAKAAVKRRISSLASWLLDPDRPGRHNEAVMELGARVCTPKSPRCTECPLGRWCRAFAEGRPEDFPARAPRRTVPHHDIAVAVIRDDTGRLLIQRRPDDAMLGGLWEFPGGKVEPGETPVEACRREVGEELGLQVEVGGAYPVIDHAYSHFRISLHAFSCRVDGNGPEVRTTLPARWVVAEELAAYAFPRANRRLIEELGRV